MSLSTAQIISKAKAFAEANYDNGLDFFVEGYGDDEWLDYIQTFNGWSEVKAEMKSHAARRAEYAADIVGQ